MMVLAIILEDLLLMFARLHLVILQVEESTVVLILTATVGPIQETHYQITLHNISIQMEMDTVTIRMVQMLTIVH